MEEQVKAGVPKLSDEERRAALRKAVEVRRRNKELLDRVRLGETSFAEALADPAYERIRVKRLLLSVPGVGSARCGLWFSEARIDENRRVKGLGLRQREYLLNAVGALASRKGAAGSN